MRAVRLHGIGQLKFEHVDAPGALAADSVRIRVQAVGVCGSDLHNFRTGQWMSRVPVIPGHEVAGEITEVGANVSQFRAGELVVADSRANCGECRNCLEGRPNVCEHMGYLGEVCDGGFAEWLRLPATRVLRVPTGVEARIAALAEPLGVALRVARRLDPAHAAPILIAGAGPIGGLAAIVLEHLGFGPLFIVDRNVARAQLVASITGARIVSFDLQQLQRELDGARLSYAIEATGAPAMLSLVLAALSAGGRAAMVGIFSGQPALDANALVERELELRGCSVFCDEQHEALALLPQLAAKLERVISPPVTLEQLPQEYERLLAGHSPYLKSIVQP